MKDFKRILFYADGAPGERAALSRAVALAEHNKGEVLVVDTVAEAGMEKMSDKVAKAVYKVQKGLIKERQDVLDKMIASVTEGRKKPRVKSMVVPGRDTLAIIKLVNEKKVDLVIKGIDKTSIVTAFFGTHDLRLMRKCPCPVWIIKPTRRKKLRKIVAAVDPGHSNKEGKDLNQRILDCAETLASKESAELHVLNVWQFPLEPSMEKELRAGDFDRMFLTMKEEMHREQDQLTQGVSMPFETHMIKGVADDVITSFVHNHEVDLLIMGTVGRSGIPGFFIGNTAEKILNRVDSSVLTLKPKGFKLNVK